MPKSVTLGDALGVHDHVVRLEVAVDHAALVARTRRRCRIWTPEVDHAHLVERRLLGHDVLERPPAQVLHRDVVGAVVVAAVVDADHVGVLEARGGLGLAPEPLHELGVLGEAPVQHLQRHLAARGGCPRRGRRRPCRRSRCGRGSCSGRRPSCRLATSVTRRSPSSALEHLLGDRRGLGAALALRALDRHGDRHPRIVQRGEADEPRLVRGGVVHLGGARLAADARCPRARPRCPCPPPPRCPSSAVSWPAASRDITRDCCAGFTSSARPSLATIFSVSRGCISTPPLPTAPATIAICSGVTWIWPSSPPWPMATRPTSKPSLRHELALRVAHAAGQHLPVRVVQRRVLAEAEPLHVVHRVSSPTCLAHLGEDRVHRVGEGVGERDRAEVLSARVRQRHPADLARRGAVDDRVGRVLAAVERGGGGHDLEGGAGRVARLGRAVEQRLGLVGGQRRERLRHQVRVVLGHAHHHAHPAGLRAPARRPSRCRPPSASQRGALRRRGRAWWSRPCPRASSRLELGEDVLELVLLAGQLVVARTAPGPPGRAR